MMSQNESSKAPASELITFLILELQRVPFHASRFERASQIFGQLESAARELIDENQSLKEKAEMRAKAVEILNSYKGAELAAECDGLSSEKKMILLNKLHAAFWAATAEIGGHEYRVSDIRDVFEALEAVSKKR